MSLKVYRGRTLARSQALQLLFQAEATDSPLERVLEGDFLISKGPLDPMRWSCAAVPTSISTASTALCDPLPRTGILCACPAPTAICCVSLFTRCVSSPTRRSRTHRDQRGCRACQGLWHRPVRIVRQRRAGQDRSQRGAAGRGPVPGAAGRRSRSRGGAGCRAAAKVAVAQAEAGVLAEDADAAEADIDSVEE